MPGEATLSVENARGRRLGSKLPSRGCNVALSVLTGPTVDSRASGAFPAAEMVSGGWEKGPYSPSGPARTSGTTG